MRNLAKIILLSVIVSSFNPGLILSAPITPPPSPTPIIGVYNPACATRGTGISQTDVNNALQQGHGYIIDRPGYYCLTSRIRVSLAPGADRAVFVIRVPWSQESMPIEFDLNGLTIEDTGMPALFKTAILLESGSSVSIHNGAIMNFGYGIRRSDYIGRNYHFYSLLFQSSFGADIYATLGGRGYLVENNAGIESANGIIIDETFTSYSQPTVIWQNNISLAKNGSLLYGTRDSRYPSNQMGIMVMASTTPTDGPSITENDVALSPSAGTAQIGIYTDAARVVIKQNTMRNAQSGVGIFTSSPGLPYKVDITQNTINALNDFCKFPEDKNGKGKGVVLFQSWAPTDITWNTFSGPFAYPIEIIDSTQVNAANNIFYYTNPFNLLRIVNSVVTQTGNYVGDSCII